MEYGFISILFLQCFIVPYLIENRCILEAMFHSFRALEGLAITLYKRETENQKRKNGRPLFDWLRMNGPLDWRNNQFLQDLIVPYSKDEQEAMDNDLLGARNTLFHNFSGFMEENLFSAWRANNVRDWENKVCSCLNLISGQEFSTLEEASIIPTVHQELETAIAALTQSPK
jgi:hypothetical protein